MRVETVITFPWFDSRLMPNAARRMHWAAKGKVAKTARQAAYWLTKAAVGNTAWGDGEIMLTIVLFPPDKRHRDLDNCVAAMKPWLDGLADAMKVNDRQFALTFRWGDAAKPGRVDIAISV